MTALKYIFTTLDSRFEMIEISVKPIRGFIFNVGGGGGLRLQKKIKQKY